MVLVCGWSRSMADLRASPDSIELRLILRFVPPVEIGWRLAKWAWGHGYATEAAGRVLKAAFENFGLTEVFSFTTETNTKSEAVMQRINMSRRVDLDFDHPKTPGWWGAKHIVYQASVKEY